MDASEAMSSTLSAMLDEHGEEVTFWRRSKGLGGAAKAGFRTPVPRAPLRITVLFAERLGGKKDGTSKVYVEADAVEEHSLTSPGEEWDVQRNNEPERMPVTGTFRPIGSKEDATWWSGKVGTGGGEANAG